MSRTLPSHPVPSAPRRLLAVVSLAVLAASAPLLAAPEVKDLRTPPADAVRSASGLVSMVLEPGTGDRHPDANDIVSAHFIGRTPDGKVFQDSYVHENPQVFNLAQVFPGWREGLQQMVIGETRRLWIPGALGAQDADQGPVGDVVFDVELIGILYLPNPPESVSRPDDDAVALPGGAHTKRVEEGHGTVHPAPNDAALVHYTGFDENGDVFDSTRARRRPTVMPLAKISPAFTDCVVQMVEGESRWCWLPPDVAEGQWPNAPGGPIAIFVELVRIGDGSASEAPPGT